MIQIKNKIDCCGCTACASICPKSCISMARDEEGFLYPIIDENNCVNCHLCEKTCPVIGREKTTAQPDKDKLELNRIAVKNADYIPEAYVGFIKNDKLRLQSTSGGLFTALAEVVLKQGGIVCGVILDESQKVVHTFAENFEELSRMRRSKYVQSDQTGIYIKIKNFLKKNRLVLYSGTPCQVAGLKKYLGRAYDNLLTVDIFCHGVGSPLYWEKYLGYISKKMNSKICEVRFREKTYGYNSACLSVYFQNGKSTHKGHDDDLYWTAFSKNYIYRPSCYECAFKTVNHVSDFTIGDFWKTDSLPNCFQKANGVSLFLCHTSMAKALVDKISDSIELTSVELDEALNINGGHQASMLIACPKVPEDRSAMFMDMNTLSPQELVNKYIPLGTKGKIKGILKPILYKMGLLEKIKSK